MYHLTKATFLQKNYHVTVYSSQVDLLWLAERSYHLIIQFFNISCPLTEL